MPGLLQKKTQKKWTVCDTEKSCGLSNQSAFFLPRPAAATTNGLQLPPSTSDGRDDDTPITYESVSGGRCRRAGRPHMRPIVQTVRWNYFYSCLINIASPTMKAVYNARRIFIIARLHAKQYRAQYWYSNFWSFTVYVKIMEHTGVHD